MMTTTNEEEKEVQLVDKDELLGYIDIYDNLMIDMYFKIHNKIGTSYEHQAIGNFGWGALLHVGHHRSQRFPLIEFLPSTTELHIAASTPIVFNDGILLQDAPLNIDEIYHIKIEFNQTDFMVYINDKKKSHQSHFHHAIQQKAPIFACTSNSLYKEYYTCADITVYNLTIHSWDNQNSTTDNIFYYNHPYSVKNKKQTKWKFIPVSYTPMKLIIGSIIIGLIGALILFLFLYLKHIHNKIKDMINDNDYRAFPVTESSETPIPFEFDHLGSGDAVPISDDDDDEKKNENKNVAKNFINQIYDGDNEAVVIYKENNIQQSYDPHDEELVLITPVNNHYNDT